MSVIDTKRLNMIKVKTALVEKYQHRLTGASSKPKRQHFKAKVRKYQAELQKLL